jgi:hypothetical protein
MYINRMFKKTTLTCQPCVVSLYLFIYETVPFVFGIKALTHIWNAFIERYSFDIFISKAQVNPTVSQDWPAVKAVIRSKSSKTEATLHWLSSAWRCKLFQAIFPRQNPSIWISIWILRKDQSGRARFLKEIYSQFYFRNSTVLKPQKWCIFLFTDLW